MQSKDIQTAVKTRYENGDGLTKICCNVGRVVSLTITKS